MNTLTYIAHAGHVHNEGTATLLASILIGGLSVVIVGAVVALIAYDKRRKNVRATSSKVKLEKS